MLTALALLATALAHAQTTPTIAAKTAGMTKWDGYFPLYWDERNGKLYVEISRWNMDFLYVSSLPAGLGSNDVGLDRGQLGRTRVVRMERTGPKVLMVQRNFGYRASSNNVDERRAVAESFAESVIWGFSVEARDGDRVLVDATNFYLRDAHGVPERLSSSNQGTFRLDAARSALYLPRTKNFPKNTEVEATLTFSGERPGRYVRDVAPSPDSITLREHHSFIELPDDNYQPRTFDPRAGYFGTSFFDFATPVGDRVRPPWTSPTAHRSF
ncbi:MAG: DUF5117 domain-containing protein, partial [Candidatus Solibacter usitatus]|nr:DUF5117 domain-containing protein [Candidatus Solibacter usitatus]